jgi:hypothetical protein
MVARIGAQPMTMPSGAPIFEVRATLADGTRQLLGLYATEAEATGHVQLLIVAGVATRVETVKRVDGQVEVVAVAGQRSRFGARRNPDRF